jgi:serine protease Do
VQIDQVTKEVAESLGLGKAQGVLVRGVEEGSPADKAGIEAGDIILRFDGKALEKAADLPRMVGNTKPGSRVSLTVFRRGANKELNVTVAEIEAEKTTAQRSTDKKATPASGEHFGLVVADLTDAQKKELRVRGGARVESAAEPATRAGLREGDVILAIANQEVLSAKDFDSIMGRVDKARPVSLLIRRGDAAQYVLIRPAK